MGRRGSVDPPGPLFFMPDALAPWRSQNWRRRGFDASVPVPTRAEMRKEAKHEVEEPTPLAAEEPPAPAENSNPTSDGSDPEADESDASASRSKKSLAQRARDKKAAVSVPAKDGIVIGIMDLKIVKGMTVSLASYNVFTPKLGHSVWRKHSDFVWLRTLLKTRYEGMLVPSIPPRLLGNASLALCEPRKRLLAQFLTRLGFDELLRRDPAVFAFISIADDAHWAKYMKDTNVASGAGAAWVDKCVAAAPADPATAAKEVAAYKARFAAHEKHLVKLDATASAVAAASRSLNKAVKKCAGVATVYANDDTGLGGDAATQVRASVGHMARAFTSWARDSALGPVVLNEVLKTGVTYELQQVNAFNELLAARDAKVAEVEKRRKKLEKHQALKASGASETAGSRFSGIAPKSMVSQKQDIDDVIKHAASDVKDAEDEVACADGALMGSQFKKFDDEMQEAFASLVGMVSVGMLKVQEHGSNAWQKALTEGTDADRMTNKIKAVIPEFDDYGAVADGKDTVDEEDGLGRSEGTGV